MKTLYILFIGLLVSSGVLAQSCLPDGIDFHSQAQIDSFQILYPNCSEIEGGVTIGGSVWGSDITNLNGLSMLTSIGGLTISFLQISDLSGLENLSSINGSFIIFAIPNLMSLEGLENLTDIDGTLQIGFVNFESSLTNLDALINLTSINGSLRIIGNPNITSLEGLDNIVASSIVGISIQENASLSTCEVQSICDYLSSPNGSISIHDNAIGCNTPEEVLDSCETHAGIIDVLSMVEGLLIYPNPSNSTIIIELSATPSNNTFLTLYNLNGQHLITQPITEPQTVVDVSGLPQGVYFVKVMSDENVVVQKVIKQ